MRERSRATCPELAEATGLSLVTVHKEVHYLCKRGELHATRERQSRGGRPSPLYEYNARYALRALLEIRRHGAVVQVQLSLSDLQGRPLSSQQSVYAALERESLDGVLDAALHRQRVVGIALICPAGRMADELRAHLQQRYRCPVANVNAAEALADAHEGAATLYLSRGEAPQCCMYRNGRLQPTGRLELLPLPAAWETIDYSDRTLVEEMVARLLQILTCTLAPERISLHADFWTTRLTDRIRFNTASKLRATALPGLHFHHTTAAEAQALLRANALNAIE